MRMLDFLPLSPDCSAGDLAFFSVAELDQEDSWLIKGISQVVKLYCELKSFQKKFASENSPCSSDPTTAVRS